MLDLMTGFVVELRNAGLPVSLTENLDAMEAITHIPIEDREAFKYALGATLSFLTTGQSPLSSWNTPAEKLTALAEGNFAAGEQQIAHRNDAIPWGPGPPSAPVDGRSEAVAEEGRRGIERSGQCGLLDLHSGLRAAL